MFRGRARQCASGSKIEGSRARRRRRRRLRRRGAASAPPVGEGQREKREIYLPEFRRGGRCRGRFQGMHFAFGIFHGICSATGRRGRRRAWAPKLDQRNQSPWFVIVFVGPGAVLTTRRSAFHGATEARRSCTRGSLRIRRVFLSGGKLVDRPSRAKPVVAAYWDDV